ncbi:MAG: HAD family hydrolase [Candidatus Hermodarchaeota archaeon]
MSKRDNIVISFDLDYTLINNRKGIVNSFNYALKKFNLSPIRKSVIEKMIGIPLNEMFTKFTDKDPSELSLAFREYYAAIGIYQSKLLTGAKDILKELKAHDYTLGIITSKKQSIAAKIAQYLKIDNFFDFILGETDSIKSKLDPNLTKFLLESYPSSQFVIIGDHPKDAMLAKNLNCSFIGVLTGFHTKNQLLEARKQRNQTQIVKKVYNISIDIINSILKNSNLESNKKR